MGKNNIKKEKEMNIQGLMIHEAKKWTDNDGEDDDRKKKIHNEKVKEIKGAHKTTTQTTTILEKEYNQHQSIKTINEGSLEKNGTSEEVTSQSLIIDDDK